MLISYQRPLQVTYFEITHNTNKITGFRPGSTLCREHVSWHTEWVDGEEITYLIIQIPEPKEQAEANSTVSVELLPSGDFWCPITAFKKFTNIYTGLGPGMPLFSDGSRLMTAGHVNETLRRLLSAHVDYRTQQIQGHSFRSGVVSALTRVGADKDTVMSKVGSEFHLLLEIDNVIILGEVELRSLLQLH